MAFDKAKAYLEGYEWHDWDWQNQRDNTKVLERPMSIQDDGRQ